MSTIVEQITNCVEENYSELIKNYYSSEDIAEAAEIPINHVTGTHIHRVMAKRGFRRKQLNGTKVWYHPKEGNYGSSQVQQSGQSTREDKGGERSSGQIPSNKRWEGSGTRSTPKQDQKKELKEKKVDHLTKVRANEIAKEFNQPLPYPEIEKPKGKPGRPTKLNDEVQEKICSEIKKCESFKTSVALAGLSYKVAEEWMTKGKQATSGKYREFYLAVQDARQHAISEMTQVARTYAKRGNSQLIQAFLRRFDNDRWGEKSHVKAEHQVSGSLNINLSDMSDDELKAELEKVKHLAGKE